MSLTALEWLALPEEERERRKDELSSHECFLLRTAYAHFPAGPEHYPDGPLKPLSAEEKEKRSKIFFQFYQEVLKTIPAEMTWEEWVRKGEPLNM